MRVRRGPFCYTQQSVRVAVGVRAGRAALHGERGHLQLVHRRAAEPHQHPAAGGPPGSLLSCRATAGPLCPGGGLCPAPPSMPTICHMAGRDPGSLLSIPLAIQAMRCRPSWWCFRQTSASCCALSGIPFACIWLKMPENFGYIMRCILLLWLICNQVSSPRVCLYSHPCIMHLRGLRVRVAGAQPGPQNPKTHPCIVQTRGAALCRCPARG